jgi:hypothetical protein
MRIHNLVLCRACAWVDVSNEIALQTLSSEWAKKYNKQTSSTKVRGDFV